MKEKPEDQKPIDPEVEELIEGEESKLPPAKLAARQARADQRRQVRELRSFTEEEAREVFTAAGLTRTALAERMNLWRAYVKSR